MNWKYRLMKIKLKWMEAKNNVDGLIKVLNDGYTERDFQLKVIDVLKKIRDERVVWTIIDALEWSWPNDDYAMFHDALYDTNYYSYYLTEKGKKAFEALIEMGELAVEPLIKVLRIRKSPGVIPGIVAEALGCIGDIRAVSPLIRSLKYKNFNTQDKARDALEEITGQNFDQDFKKWQKWWKQNMGKFGK